MPNLKLNENQMRSIANMLGKQALPTQPQPLAPQAPIQNILPIPLNENNMPMFNTDTEYLDYLQEYDPEMFMKMQNQYMTTLGGIGEGKIKPMQYIKGLLGL